MICCILATCLGGKKNVQIEDFLPFGRDPSKWKSVDEDVKLMQSIGAMIRNNASS